MLLRTCICWWGILLTVLLFASDPSDQPVFQIALENTTEIYFEGGPTSLQELLCGPENRPLVPNTTPLRSQIWENLLAWMQECQQRGINVFNLPILNSEGITLCDFPTLKKAKFRMIQEVGDLFPLIALEAKRRDLILSIPLDELGDIAEDEQLGSSWTEKSFLTPTQFGKFVEELGEAAKTYEVTLWINEQRLARKYRSPISQAANQYQIKYVRYSGDAEGFADLFCSEEYATFPTCLNQPTKENEYIYHLAQNGTAYGRLGYQNMIYGLANTRKKATGMICASGWGLDEGVQSNIALYRAVQFNPCLYGFYQKNIEKKQSHIPQFSLRNFKYHKDLLPRIQQFQRSEKDIAKPIANLIINISPKLDAADTVNAMEAMTSSLEAITNAITAAGFELYVTFQNPIPDAKLYYIITAGEWDTSLLLLFPNPQPIFLQNCWGFPEGAVWEQAASLFGIPLNSRMLHNPHQSYIPQQISYPYAPDIMLPYRGFQFNIEQARDAGKLVTLQQLADIKLENLSNSTNIIAANNQIALITQKQNYFFVNGNFLHLSVSNILANLMASTPIFSCPAPIYLTTSPERVAILAADHTPIDLYLPLQQQKTIYHFNQQGHLYPKTNLCWKQDHLVGNILQWELVIILTNESATNTDTTPADQK